MTDVRDQLRAYFDEVDRPFVVEDLMREPRPESWPSRSRDRNGLVIAAVAAIVVVLVVGLPVVLWRGQPEPYVAPGPAGDEPVPATVTPTTATATNATDQSWSQGWQQIAVSEAWVESLIDLESLPDGGFIAARGNPWGLLWSPDGSAWFDADPESQVAEYVRLAGEDYPEFEEPDHWLELVNTPPLIATLGDSTVILDPANVGMWVGDPRRGEWESIRFDIAGFNSLNGTDWTAWESIRLDSTDSGGPPHLLTIAASDTEAMVIARSPAGDYLSLTATADGVTSDWTPIPFSHRRYHSGSSNVGWFQDRWVLVLQEHDDTGFFVSSDGRGWTEVDPPEDCCGHFVDMTIGQAGVVLSSFFPYEDTPSAFSSDGVSWVGFVRDSPSSAYSDALGYVSIVASRDGARLEVSEDGRTWQWKSDAPPSLAYPALLTASGRTLLAYDAWGEESALPELWAWSPG